MDTILDNQDSLIHGAENISRRVERLEEGRRENALLAQSAANAVVDLKEDLHELKNDVKEIKGMVQTAINESAEAARQGRITNGRMNAMELWRDEHNKEVTPIIQKAEAAFQELKRVAGIADAANKRYITTNTVRGMLRSFVTNGWKIVLTFAGGILLGTQLWDKFK